MFCLNCGQQLRDGSKFCPYCGTVLSAETEPSYPPAAETTLLEPEMVDAAPQYATPAPSTEPPFVPVKKHRGRLLIGAAGAVVAVALVVTMVASGAFSSPKRKVSRAFVKSAEAYAAAVEKVDIPDLSKIYKDQNASASVSVQLSDLNEEMLLGTSEYDLSGLNGLGVRYALDLDIPNRKGGAEATAFWGASDLISAQLALDNGVIAASVPELTDDTFYGLNTETLGADLSDLGVDDEEVEAISFNIFDIYELFTPDLKENEESAKLMKDAGKALVEAIEVEKTGKGAVDVNGSSVKCATYHVIIPQDAMEDYVDVLEDVVSSSADTYLDALVDAVEESGLVDDYEIDYFKESLSDVDDGVKEAADVMKEVLDVIGDLELDAHISDGKIMAVTYEGEIEDVDVEIGVYMGGGKNYADDFSIVFNGKGYGDTVKIELVSTGDHTAKGGAFTDETTLKVREDGDTLASFKSELRYEPKAKENNFSWTVKFDDAASFSAEGQLNLEKNSLSVHLDDLTIKADGTKIVSLEADYAIGPCSKVAVTAASPVMLSDLDEDDLMDIAEDIEDNAMDLAETLYDLVEDNLPSEIAEMLLWEMRYMF